MLQNYIFDKVKGIKSMYVCLFMLVAGTAWAQGQLPDKLYLANETTVSNVEITDLSKKRIKVRNQEGKEISFKVKEVLIAFNGNGQYLTFPAKAEQQQQFLNGQNKQAQADLILTLSGEVIPARIEEENTAEISYQAAGNSGANHLPVTKIAAVIYKNGDHKLYTSPSRGAGVLAPLQEQVAKARQESPQIAEEPAEKPAVNPFASTKAEDTAVASTATNEQPAESELEASMEIDPEVYSRRALQKTADLGTYLSIISDRSNSAAEANKAVELAVKLFIDENAQIEVSSKEGRDRYKVRAYLNRLKLLKYDKVEISWTDISYVSNLKKGLDGNYYGVITLQQRFKGFIDNEVVYSDLTEKNIEVMVVPYQKETDGTQEQKWDVFLSDVGVVVTKFDQ